MTISIIQIQEIIHFLIPKRVLMKTIIILTTTTTKIISIIALEDSTSLASPSSGTTG